jgi:hypothetical protein
MLDVSKVSNVVVEGIDYSDYPDFCDAYICSADYEGQPMTEEQLDELNDEHDFVYQQVMGRIF